MERKQIFCNYRGQEKKIVSGMFDIMIRRFLHIKIKDTETRRWIMINILKYWLKFCPFRIEKYFEIPLLFSFQTFVVNCFCFWTLSLFHIRNSRSAQVIFSRKPIRQWMMKTNGKMNSKESCSLSIYLWGRYSCGASNGYYWTKMFEMINKNVMPPEESFY